MAHKLKAPYTEADKIKFLELYEYSGICTIQETPEALYALERWETLEDGKVVDHKEEYEAEKKREELKRIMNLNLTAADVERGIHKAKGMDFEDLVKFIVDSEIAGLNIKELKIELRANNFYRGNPYVIAVGKILGFTDDQLNAFFTDGNYEHLLPPKEEE